MHTPVIVSTVTWCVHRVCTIGYYRYTCIEVCVTFRDQILSPEYVCDSKELKRTKTDVSQLVCK